MGPFKQGPQSGNLNHGTGIWIAGLLHLVASINQTQHTSIKQIPYESRFSRSFNTGLRIPSGGLTLHVMKDSTFKPVAGVQEQAVGDSSTEDGPDNGEERARDRSCCKLLTITWKVLENYIVESTHAVLIKSHASMVDKHKKQGKGVLYKVSGKVTVKFNMMDQDKTDASRVWYCPCNALRGAGQVQSENRAWSYQRSPQCQACSDIGIPLTSNKSYSTSRALWRDCNALHW